MTVIGMTCRELPNFPLACRDGEFHLLDRRQEVEGERSGAGILSLIPELLSSLADQPRSWRKRNSNTTLKLGGFPGFLSYRYLYTALSYVPE